MIVCLNDKIADDLEKYVIVTNGTIDLCQA